MLKNVLLISIALAIAIAGGAASVVYALDRFNGAGGVTIGPWATFPSFGTADADPYAKARFAREGGLALGQAEGISFTANRDSLGQPLTADCAYRFEGVVPPARFWTLQATDAAGDPLTGVGRRKPALESRSLLRSPDGAVEIRIGSEPAPGNWLAISGAGPMRLVLTLYDTPISGEAGVMDVELPEIRKDGCGG